MFRHHVAGLPSACLRAPDTSGCARAWIYFAQRPAVFKGKRCEEQYVITYITNVISLYVVTKLYTSQQHTAPTLRHRCTRAQWHEKPLWGWVCAKVWVQCECASRTDKSITLCVKQISPFHTTDHLSILS
jgi:hypothetical protein